MRSNKIFTDHCPKGDDVLTDNLQEHSQGTVQHKWNASQPEIQNKYWSKEALAKHYNVNLLVFLWPLLNVISTSFQESNVFDKPLCYFSD